MSRFANEPLSTVITTTFDRQELDVPASWAVVQGSIFTGVPTSTISYNSFASFGYMWMHPKDLPKIPSRAFLLEWIWMQSPVKPLCLSFRLG